MIGNDSSISGLDARGRRIADPYEVKPQVLVEVESRAKVGIPGHAKRYGPGTFEVKVRKDLLPALYDKLETKQDEWKRCVRARNQHVLDKVVDSLRLAHLSSRELGLRDSEEESLDEFKRQILEHVAYADHALASRVIDEASRPDKHGNGGSPEAVFYSRSSDYIRDEKIHKITYTDQGATVTEYWRTKKRSRLPIDRITVKEELPPEVPIAHQRAMEMQNLTIENLNNRGLLGASSGGDGELKAMLQQVIEDNKKLKAELESIKTSQQSGGNKRR